MKVFQIFHFEELLISILMQTIPNQ